MSPSRRPAFLNKIVFMSLGILVILLSSLVLFFMPLEEKGYSAGYVKDAQDSLRTSTIRIPHNVVIGDYFPFMDSLVTAFQPNLPYHLTEHLLVHANPWIIDTLANTDYYRMIARDSFVYDQKKLQVLRKGDHLKIPPLKEAQRIDEFLGELQLDINIPEFKMRIYRGHLMLYEFPVRVGRNEKKYLAMGDRLTDLRTQRGSGRIVRHAKDPDFYNPVNHKQFFTTKRDDGQRTLMPQIPWIETEINGLRNGQMIHPTTNPETLGRAYSNGCIGTGEGDAWIIYYYAPIGTEIVIRYDLQLPDGESLSDIYNLY